MSKPATRPTAPLWLRLAEHAVDHANPAGIAFYAPGELRRAMGVQHAAMVSRAIVRAVQAGWLHPRSTTRALYVHPSKRRERTPR
jgi:hypothetical protein